MDRSAGAALRWSRALLLTTVAFVSGLVGHVLAGGLVPGRGLLVTVFGVTLAASASWLGRPASALRMVVLVVTGQTFVHGAMTAAAGHAGGPALARAHAAESAGTGAATLTSAGGSRVGSFYDVVYGHERLPPAALSVPTPVQHILDDLTGANAMMALAHIAAAVVVAWWLVVGERALWTVVALAGDGVLDLISVFLVGAVAALRGQFAGPATPAPVQALALDLRRSGSVAFPRGRVVTGRLVRRGPPVLAAA